MDPLTQQPAAPATPASSSPSHMESSSSLVWPAVIAVVASLVVVVSSVWWMPLVGLGQSSVNSTPASTQDSMGTSTLSLSAQVQGALQNITQLQSRVRWVSTDGSVFSVNLGAGWMVVQVPSPYVEGKSLYQKIYLDPSTAIELLTNKFETVSGQSVRVGTMHAPASSGAQDIKVGDMVAVDSLYKTATSTGSTSAMHAVQVLIMR